MGIFKNIVGMYKQNIQETGQAYKDAFKDVKDAVTGGGKQAAPVSKKSGTRAKAAAPGGHIDLWQGITTAMSVEETAEKVREILEASSFDELSVYSEIGYMVGKYDEVIVDRDPFGHAISTQHIPQWSDDKKQGYVPGEGMYEYNFSGTEYIDTHPHRWNLGLYKDGEIKLDGFRLGNPTGESPYEWVDVLFWEEKPLRIMVMPKREYKAEFEQAVVERYGDTNPANGLKFIPDTKQIGGKEICCGLVNLSLGDDRRDWRIPTLIIADYKREAECCIKNKRRQEELAKKRAGKISF